MLAVVLLSFPFCAWAQGDAAARGVRVDPPLRQRSQTPGPFDATQSAALFIGVRDFAQPHLGEIRFSVDDAVDLAYVMALDRKVRLVMPRRVVLALSNEPIKATSRERLQRLKENGASVVKADRETIAAQLESQTALAGADGLMILFAASHGFSSEGTPYVLASTSLFEDTASSLSAAKMLDLAAASPARRSLVFIDACRERVPAGRRAPYYRARSTAPMIERMSPMEGQVVFYAAAPGGWAYEDQENGVFTRAIVESLSDCDAEKRGGMVTAETLAQQVEKRVWTWIRRHRDRGARKATQSLMDHDTKNMPLALCSPPPKPFSVSTAEASMTVLDEDRKPLWEARGGARITVTRVVDLDDDKSPEVVVGDASGAVTVFTADGEALWSEKTAEGMPVTALTIDYLFAKKDKRHILALSNAADGRSSLLTAFTSDGTLQFRHPHDGRLLHAVVDRVTARHKAQIIVTSTASLFMLDRKGPPRVWHAGLVPQPPQTITALRTIDINNDGYRDIEVKTTAGTIYVKFDGSTIRTNGPLLTK